MISHIYLQSKSPNTIQFDFRELWRDLGMIIYWSDNMDSFVHIYVFCLLSELGNFIWVFLFFRQFGGSNIAYTDITKIRLNRKKIKFPNEFLL